MRLVYVCAGGAGLGWGHFSRAFALWEAAPAEVTVAVGQGLGQFRDWAQRHGWDIPTIPWRTPDGPLQPGDPAFDVIVVDDYLVPADWIAALSRAGCAAVVDDWMRTDVRASVLINPNLGAAVADYHGEGVTRWLTGEQYTIVRRAFRQQRHQSGGGSAGGPVLVTLGGSDPGGHTPAVADALAGLPWFERNGELTLILGSGYEGPEPWRAWSEQRRRRLTVLRDPADYVQRCAAARLVICGAGVSSYELAVMGRPFLPVALVDNQARVAREWSQRGIGPGLAVWQDDWLDRLAEAAGHLLDNEAARTSIAGKGASLIDGLGVERVVEQLRDWRSAR